ncbi:MAG TPA: 3-hydroxybutyryl-CoA dehydrogenase [Syntrophothermus lipocalidus]|uniref:3-hydroxybutyryl-CoA dehydrogenase n=1 Tax=Syntrophothermus lipocalidus (strain DSM 12680 / TGB-C1) TaxID=643648 RepID=D7CN93_SYNLT|nr:MULTISPECIES: 3-hydroxybutyryl-CoA dehydrogenase [Syntrophothermus]ADI02178.1 3-hydroxyacyl-CoA dehydrogenase NAD-binding protein [Syntrophothermus lipocalidus DSM 12680]NSW82017.1 3-hydroxybutyryl-CoA dehydrogenase [Syntrophothermus sp.]HHV75979.1 3-hydroxybutyryl-CoA dehydrogenase [Syntrophothermus lipocalidus]
MKIMVLGAGTMGAGIVQVAAQAGFEVIVRDIKQEFVDNGIKGIDKGLSKMVEKGKMSADDKNAVMARISGTVDMAAAKDVDVVIEAAIENMDIKKAIFKELDEICKPECILASNTSALSITEIGAATKRADRVIGMHFFNPVPAMKLIEIIKGASTSQETFNTIKDLSIKLGKTPVEINEAPGFVVNRLLIPMLNEGMYAVMEGVASPEDVDTSMKLGAGHPMGPLALADMIGLDICLAIMQTLHREFGDDKYRPCPLLVKMVRAGKLGRKTGEGFFKY